jgi:hypothetical protein
MSIEEDLAKGRVSRLVIFPSGNPDRELTEADVRQITLPPDATVRFGEHEVFIPRGQTKVVGPWDGDYVLVSPSPTVWISES